MRILFTFICVLALGVMGCSETSGAGGSGGDGGGAGDGGDGGSGGITECQSPEDCDDDNECTDDTCLAGVCEFSAVPDPMGPDEPGDPPGEGTTCGYYEGTCQGGSCAGTFACTEAGIREAIAAGAGPHTFACGGPTTVVTKDTIFIDNDVILNGEGKLTVDGALPAEDPHTVFSVADGVTAELHSLTVTGGKALPGCCFIVPDGGGILNEGTVTLTNSTVSGSGVGILNQGGTLVLTHSTVSGNAGAGIEGRDDGSAIRLTNSALTGNGAGLIHGGTATVTNTTVSGNSEHGVWCMGALTVTNSTVSQNMTGILCEGTCTVANTLIDGECEDDITSNGYNIESPGNTCGFDQTGDQSGVTTEQLNLGELAANGGPTMTHALLTEPIVSVAVDVIPAGDCFDAEGELLRTDQRGEPRFVGLPFGLSEPVGDGCDVGAFEVQPEP